MEKTLVIRKRKRRLEVNMVPLVDVLAVLLFFLLVTMQFRNLQTLNITVPEIETAGRSELTEPINIAVDKEDQIYLNNEPVSLAELETAIRIAAAANRELPVLLIADEETALRNVTKIMDLCRKHGLERLRLQSR